MRTINDRPYGCAEAFAGNIPISDDNRNSLLYNGNNDYVLFMRKEDIP